MLCAYRGAYDPVEPFSVNGSRDLLCRKTQEPCLESGSAHSASLFPAGPLSHYAYAIFSSSFRISSLPIS